MDKTIRQLDEVIQIDFANDYLLVDQQDRERKLRLNVLKDALVPPTLGAKNPDTLRFYDPCNEQKFPITQDAALDIEPLCEKRVLIECIWQYDTPNFSSLQFNFEPLNGKRVYLDISVSLNAPAGAVGSLSLECVGTLPLLKVGSLHVPSPYFKDIRPIFSGFYLIKNNYPIKL